MIRLTYMYWLNGGEGAVGGQTSIRAQTVSLIMVSNVQLYFWLWREMFNDSLMAFYLVLAVYLLVANRPVWASILLSVSVSIKVGGVLMLPAFLGSI